MTIHDRKSGAIRMACAGGIQLSVDCTRAFDSMPHRVMYDMLVWAGVDVDLIALILEWHNTGTYRHGSHAEAQHTIRRNQGVKQGCVLAPSLWTIYMAYVMFQIDLRCSSGSNGLTWSQEHATAYADDLHFRWMMLAVRDLRQMREELAEVLNVLFEMGLTINREKSVLVISVKGIQAQTWLHKHISKNSAGQRQFCYNEFRKWHLPIVTSYKYLGVILSYGSFEEQTARFSDSAGGRAPLQTTASLAGAWWHFHPSTTPALEGLRRNQSELRAGSCRDDQSESASGTCSETAALACNLSQT